MKFLLDVMLGKLATYLRMCGHDVAYALDRDVEADNALLALAREEHRTLVTRDVELARRVDDAILLDETDIEGQLRALDDAGVELSLDEPTRCSRCNGIVERLVRGEPSPAYAPSTGDTRVWQCRECGQHYWRGSHWDDVRDRLASI